MKSLYKLFVIVVIASFCQVFVACSDSEEEEIAVYTLPAVNQLRAESGEDMITLSWKNPSIDGGTYYVEVEFEKEDQTETLKVEPGTESGSTVEIPVADQKVYKFGVTVFNGTGERSEEKTVKGKALTPEVPDETEGNVYDAILETVNIYGAANSAKVIWDNPDNRAATILVSYTDASGNSIEKSADAASVLKEMVISGLAAEVEVVFTVSVKNGENGSSFSKTLSATPKHLVEKLEKSSWTVSASSEETVEEDGRAVNLIDGNPETYWRSRISGDAAVYPHYVVIDLKEVVTVTAISLERKWGDKVHSSWDNTVAVSLDGEDWNTSYDYYLTQTDPQLKIEFNRGKEGEQMYPLPTPAKGRYVRLTCKRASKTFAVFGEMSVYGYR
ncbi:discoidin domain-containing protein [Mariniphaga anaerophila]|nr:discoidin domain-containing protein [Mariniphaga anaerophila]